MKIKTNKNVTTLVSHSVIKIYKFDFNNIKNIIFQQVKFKKEEGYVKKYTVNVN